MTPPVTSEVTPGGDVSRDSGSGNSVQYRATAARFRAKVSPCPITGCWWWNGAVTSTGRGHLADGRGRDVLAHRYAWELANGPLPVGAVICHKCDQPLCVNPAHLVAATQAFNMADKVAKGRHRWGHRWENQSLARRILSDYTRAEVDALCAILAGGSARDEHPSVTLTTT